MTDSITIDGPDGVEPAPGWTWCPVCNGEGVEYVVCQPYGDESTRACGACGEVGLVPENAHFVGVQPFPEET